MQTQHILRPGTTFAVLALLALLLTAAPNGPLLAETTAPAAKHDIYSPARTALINARRQLAESYRQQEEALERTTRMHKELEASVALLEKAEQLDPSMKATIEDVRLRLASLEDKPALCPMDNKSSLDVYNELLDELQALIEQY